MKFIKCDIFSLIEKIDTICITTNGCVKKDGSNIMRKDIAKQAKDKWPGIERALGILIKTHGNHVNEIICIKGTHIVSFPIEHCSNQIDLNLIKQSVQELVESANKEGWKLIAIPKFKCSNKLWGETKIILENLDERFIICDAEEVSGEIHPTSSRESEVQSLNSASNILLQRYKKIQEKKEQEKVLESFNLEDLEMKVLTFKEVKPYIVKNHYSHSLASSMKLALGFYYSDKLVTAIIYGYPVGRRIVQWLQVEKGSCVELVRVFSEDKLPKNTESYCIGKSFKYIKENIPELKYLISYSDPNQGHVGYIYQATNWRYIGLQRRLLPERRIYIDGKEVHARTLNAKHGSTSDKNLKNIYGERLEIKPALKKHVYIMCLGSKKEKKEWYKKFPEKQYPKIKKEEI